MDSIPAVFGVTRDPFLVYTSNVCAILGLRAFYFLLAGVLPLFRYLDAGISSVLIFIGAKMLAEPWMHVPTYLLADDRRRVTGNGDCRISLRGTQR